MSESKAKVSEKWIQSLEANAEDGGLVSLAHVLQRARALEHIPPSSRASDIRRRLVLSRQIDLSVVGTQLGWIGVARSANGIVTLNLPLESREQAAADLQRKFPEGVFRDAPDEIKQELFDYGLGRRQAFSLPLDWQLTKPFQRSVLEATRRIPFGETRTYGWVARAIGAPRASRAVGRALATNPIPIIIPCHRVIASDGTLGGYGGGLPLKQRLLELERRAQVGS